MWSWSWPDPSSNTRNRPWCMLNYNSTMKWMERYYCTLTFVYINTPFEKPPSYMSVCLHAFLWYTQSHFHWYNNAYLIWSQRVINYAQSSLHLKQHCVCVFGRNEHAAAEVFDSDWRTERKRPVQLDCIKHTRYRFISQHALPSLSTKKHRPS